MSQAMTSATRWMFQYNPNLYDLNAVLQKQLTEEWTMYWGRSVVQLGERIYFMQSGGPKAAITATGRIATLVHEKPEESQKPEESSRFWRYWVRVVYDALVEPPLTRSEMLQDEVLRTYRPFATGDQRTNYVLPAEVAARTEKLVRMRLRPLEHTGIVGAKRIFVSHSHADNEFGLRLVADLRRALGGHEEAVWYDASGGLHGGNTWWSAIVAELEARPIFLVVISPDAMSSPWVIDEINLAWKLKNTRGTAIVPVLYRDCQVRADLTTLQMVSFVPPTPYEQGLQDLLTALGLSG